ncbi:metallophosphoesterase [Candidatus Woesearchaeota archaeon]|nr:metallophosphoesterase [Candidatus Woesearchaeota archaeon]MBW3021812.1 metallophosphoesterase [Candidatus Woesearchaeota archaeon]
MKLLCFSDVHGNIAKTYDKLVKIASKNEIEAVICAGDFSDFGSYLDIVFKKLNSIGKPVFAVHGNHETASVIEMAQKDFENIINIHRSLKPFKDILIIGWGGGGFSTREPGFEKFGKKAGKMMKKYEKTILVTHAPPHGTKLDVVFKDHVGNKSITEFIRVNQPTYALSGHIHESHGALQKMGKTALINLGPKGTIIEI